MKEIRENYDGSHSYYDDGKKLIEPPKVSDKEINIAVKNFRDHIRENFKNHKECFICGKDEIIKSHVIKEEILKTLAVDNSGKLKNLKTPTPPNFGHIAFLREDETLVNHKKAFIFELICDSCDKLFNKTYESKSRRREKYNKIDLKYIALKSRLKELYDLYEKRYALSYKSKSVIEEIKALGYDKEGIKISIEDEIKEINSIRNNEKEYEVYIDKFINFRTPFAIEYFLAPNLFPTSNRLIMRNTNLSLGKESLVPYYYIITPSGNKNDNWSRVTIFYNKKDGEIREWLNEAFKSTRGSTNKIINEVISYHLSYNVKNFVMAHDINESFLNKIYSFRMSSQSSRHNIDFDWVKVSRRGRSDLTDE